MIAALRQGAGMTRRFLLGALLRSAKRSETLRLRLGHYPFEQFLDVLKNHGR
jgi:hypothetical protein